MQRNQDTTSIRIREKRYILRERLYFESTPIKVRESIDTVEKNGATLPFDILEEQNGGRRGGSGEEETKGARSIK